MKRKIVYRRSPSEVTNGDILKVSDDDIIALAELLNCGEGISETCIDVDEQKLTQILETPCVIIPTKRLGRSEVQFLLSILVPNTLKYDLRRDKTRVLETFLSDDFFFKEGISIMKKSDGSFTFFKIDESKKEVEK